MYVREVGGITIAIIAAISSGFYWADQQTVLDVSDVEVSCITPKLPKPDLIVEATDLPVVLPQIKPGMVVYVKPEPDPTQVLLDAFKNVHDSVQTNQAVPKPSPSPKKPVTVDSVKATGK